MLGRAKMNFVDSVMNFLGMNVPWNNFLIKSSEGAWLEATWIAIPYLLIIILFLSLVPAMIRSWRDRVLWIKLPFKLAVWGTVIYLALDNLDLTHGLLAAYGYFLPWISGTSLILAFVLWYVGRLWWIRWFLVPLAGVSIGFWLYWNWDWVSSF